MTDIGKMKSAKDLAVELGLDEPDDGEGALLAQEYGMSGQAAEVPAGIVRGIAVITDEIIFYKNVGGNAIIEIGKRLIEAKGQLNHGEWLDWLREKVDFSERTAQDFMRIARGYANTQTIADLGTSKALVLLALPDSEREEFAAEKHEVNGVEKSASEMTVKELKQAIRERDEARMAAEQARADAQAAEDSRDKMSADMAHLKELQRMTRTEAENRAEELSAAEEELEELREELKALRDKPTDVAVQYKTDPAELAAAKEEGLSEARKQGADILNAKEEQLRKKQAEADKLREELKAARQEARDANVSLQQAQEAARSAEKARRAAEAITSPDVQAFKLFFDQAQQNVNEMAEVLRKAGKENREKMVGAMTALSDAIRRAVDNA